MIEDLECLFKATSERTRLRILCLLKSGPLCVCQVVAALGLSQSTVSRHLAVLKNARLVVDEKRGKWSYYGLAPRRGKRGDLLSLIFSLSARDHAVLADRRVLNMNTECGKQSPPTPRDQKERSHG